MKLIRVRTTKVCNFEIFNFSVPASTLKKLCLIKVQFCMQFIRLIASPDSVGIV